MKHQVMYRSFLLKEAKVCLFLFQNFYYLNMPNNSSDLIKKTVNNILDFIKQSGESPVVLPAERVLSKQFEVSRSTLIQAFLDLQEKKIVKQENRSRMVIRMPKDQDYYNHVQKVRSKTENVENYILEKFARSELKPGDKFSELQIAKEIDANTVTVREVLLKISSTGLIKKKPRKQWEVISITSETVDELTDYRQLLEIEGLKYLLKEKDDPNLIQDQYQDLLKKHQTLQKSNRINRAKIIELESEFHQGIIGHIKNRFIRDNYDSLFFLIRYHLGQRNMTQDRYQAVISEHIAVIEAILRFEYKEAVNALKRHFRESKRFFYLSNELAEAGLATLE